MSSRVLILGYGNPSRGDDAVGPLLIEYLSKLCLPDIELLTDFQLQIEHVMDLKNRELVLFLDAAVSQSQSLRLQFIQPEESHNFSTHSLTPQQLLGVYQRFSTQLPPPSYLLSIKGFKFELGENLSPEIQQHYQHAIQLLEQMLDNPRIDYWQSLTTS